ncbi:hypothetical protein FY034_13215 [Trichlorobacter lovleyi]|uniref:hypothetical protein n=1 Tax=Trichlorobacter lovleyi TaxID=313985 RepID=UPI0022407EF4|nr:hypothetical protein [Trichlorobacter lovleyi]QOX79850.1 hypothetical protein FY034_13215 [Trichlorobacter lovleyi]
MRKQLTTWFYGPLKSFLPVSFVVSYLSGGFVAGIFMCSNCSLDEPLGYLLISLIIGILSIFTGGFPPANEGGVGPALNSWPYIAGCWACIILVRLVIKKRSKEFEN